MFTTHVLYILLICRLWTKWICMCKQSLLLSVCLPSFLHYDQPHTLKLILSSSFPYSLIYLRSSFFTADIAPPPTLECTFPLPAFSSVKTQHLTSKTCYVSSRMLSPAQSHRHGCYAAASLWQPHSFPPLLCLPCRVGFWCSSPSCIPCPPLVKWLWHYTAGKAPFCRTASLSVRLSIAKAGRSLQELESEGVHASVSVWVCPSMTNKRSALHCPWCPCDIYFQAIVI